MPNNKNEALEKALQQVLNSFANAYLSLGKAYPEYDAASRSAFVRVVSGRHEEQEFEPLPDGAISFLTGLDVDDVNRLRDGQPFDAPTSSATLFIELWLDEASDTEGQANPLPLEGPLSFTALLARSGSSQDPEDALAALLSIGLVERRSDMLYLNDDALPGPTEVDEARALCAGAFPLLAAIGERGTGRKGFTESHTLPQVRETDVPRVRRVAETELRRAHSRVVELMDAYEKFGAAEDDDDNGEPRVAVSSGIFFVAREQFSGA